MKCVIFTKLNQKLKEVNWVQHFQNFDREKIPKIHVSCMLAFQGYFRPVHFRPLTFANDFTQSWIYPDLVRNIYYVLLTSYSKDIFSIF